MTAATLSDVRVIDTDSLRPSRTHGPVDVADRQQVGHSIPQVAVRPEAAVVAVSAWEISGCTYRACSVP